MVLSPVALFTRQAVRSKIQLVWLFILKMEEETPPAPEQKINIEVSTGELILAALHCVGGEVTGSWNSAPDEPPP